MNAALMLLLWRMSEPVVVYQFTYGTSIVTTTVLRDAEIVSSLRFEPSVTTTIERDVEIG